MATENKKFDLAIPPYSFRLVQVGHGQWEANAFHRDLGGSNPGRVIYPDGKRVRRPTRAAMLEYIRYAFGAKRTKKVTPEPTTSTMPVETTATALEHAKRKAADPLYQERALLERIACGCTENPKTICRKHLREVNKPDATITVNCRPGETVMEAYQREHNPDQVFRAPLAEFVETISKTLLAPIVTALDFTPEGPDLRDQIVSHIADLRKQCARYKDLSEVRDAMIDDLSAAKLALRKIVDLQFSRICTLEDDRRLATTCTTLANYPQGFFARIWAAVKGGAA